MQVPVELKLKYLKRRSQDIEKLRSLMVQNDFKEAAKLGHQVKGNAVTFEFPQMVSLGVAIEKAAQLGDRGQLSELLNRMEKMITEAHAAL